MNILSCNETLGTCCSEYEISGFVMIIKSAFDIFQIIVPLLLLVMAMFQMSKMMMYPDDKKLMKSLINKFIVATIVFLLPTLLNVTLNIVYSATGNKFDVSKCFAESKAHNANIFRGGSYIQIGEKTKLVVKSDKYELGKESKNSTGSGSGGSSNNSDLGGDTSSLVNYAKSFVGGRYCWGGNDPHKCADCSGFVVYVLNKFSKPGYVVSRASLPGFTHNYSVHFRRVNPSEARAGDIVHYPGHFAMLTGKGKQIVHASNVQTGIKLSPSYAYRNIEGIYRYKHLK